MAKSVSDRVLATPSAHARARYLYVQEIGTLTSMEPHISSRENLSSYLFLTVRRGEGYLTYRGKRHFIKAGDCVYINCRNQYAHESTAEHPWTLMWVHFSGNGADDFYKTYQEQERSSIFHPPDTSPFTDSLTALYSLMREKPSLMELYAHRYLTDLITLCFTLGRPESGQEDPLSPKLLSVPNSRAMRPSNISKTAATKISQPACAKLPFAAAKIEKNPHAKLPKVNKEGAVIAPVCFRRTTTLFSCFCSGCISSAII